MQTLTQEMLAFSRQTRPDLVESDINEIVRETVEPLTQMAVEKGVTLELVLAENLPKRFVDPDGLNKALMNLISNSLDALDDIGGTVSVSTELVRGAIDIRVADNGKGIPADKIRRIFEPFFTTKGSKGHRFGSADDKEIHRGHERDALRGERGGERDDLPHRGVATDWAEAHTGDDGPRLRAGRRPVPSHGDKG